MQCDVVQSRTERQYLKDGTASLMAQESALLRTNQLEETTGDHRVTSFGGRNETIRLNLVRVLGCQWKRSESLCPCTPRHELFPSFRGSASHSFRGRHA